ncbi:hypothetical protein Vafri_7014 [Volvox africanus]|uniref:MYND-type domain-containing protein n=1 Tax=Volvox africanus TaxID=51714 RepID=A0A8J4AZE2_9CHLO|nr:hypothetical protein Vafri_7014 [Volvox africanus]
MVGKGSTGPPAWKALLAASNEMSLLERVDLVQPIISQVQTVLDENSSLSAGSQKLFAALAVGTLNTAVAGLEPDNPQSYWQLLAVNDVVAGSDRRLAVTLVEHQFLNSLRRLHDRVGNMSHRLSQAVVLVIYSVTLSALSGSGSAETIAGAPELMDLLFAQITFLAIAPDVLLSPAGLGTAQRCLETCWELTRAPTPKCKAFREILQQAHMAGRALQIAAAAVGRGGDGDGDGGTTAGAAAAAATISQVAALADRRGVNMTAGPGAAGAGTIDNKGESSYEDRLSLAAQACSFAANLAGLGTRGIELSAAGLAPQRAWLLKSGTLAALRPPLEGLIQGLEVLRQRIEAHGPEAMASEPSSEKSQDDADLRPGPLPRKRLLNQVEGAVRNLLVLLGLPTIVMGTSEEDVVEACGFVIRHSFGLFIEGYVDTMRALRSAVADPPTTQGFTAPYQGDYAQFFRAFAGHLETVAPALGVQLEDWGVRFTGEQAARDLPVMQVAEGVDARIAYSWLKSQIQQIINWGHAIMIIVRMADQTKMAAFQQQQQQQRSQQGIDPSLPKPAAPRPYRPPGAAGEAKSADAADADGVARTCDTCGAAQQAGGPPLLWCSRCRTVRYCSRACQLGHWPYHKAACQQVAAAAAAATAAKAGQATVPTVTPPAQEHPEALRHEMPTVAADVNVDTAKATVGHSEDKEGTDAGAVERADGVAATEAERPGGAAAAVAAEGNVATGQVAAESTEAPEAAVDEALGAIEDTTEGTLRSAVSAV